MLKIFSVNIMFSKILLDDNKWCIVSDKERYDEPIKTYTFSFDTENRIIIDNKVIKENELFNILKDKELKEIKKIVSCDTWAWQYYDEYNGFFMTNDFDEFCKWVCRVGAKFGWCYNATFDFSQIDYQVLSDSKWKIHNDKEKSKSQAFSYSSLHSNMGARYSYKLWYEYKNKNRHKYVHSFDIRDFMKFAQGGLRKVLKDFNVKDNEGNEIRKLEMDYQIEDVNNLTDNEINYCMNDVKGLYFAVKMLNEGVEKISNGECCIFGKETNLITSGGFAKRELLRSMYDLPKFKRLKQFQKEHPITKEQDIFLRTNHLYRGGICLVNEKYKGKLITDRTMYRYDVNSEYPYSMSILDDMIGNPFKMKYNDYLKMKNKKDYHCILCLKSVNGELKENMIPFWFNPITKTYDEIIEEDFLHLMYEDEFNIMCEFYDIDFSCDDVILCKKGKRAYKDYVDELYKLKADYKKEGNITYSLVVKLLLNSAYGKLAEKLERKIGNYEISEETGCVHFVETGIEESESSMNVMIGAKITSIARCYILSKILEVCKGNVKDNFLYIDTDSIHCFCDYDKSDSYNLGGLKLEMRCIGCKYILPKTYIDIESLDFKGLEVHSKGISTSSVNLELKDKKITFKLIDELFTYGKKFKVLQGINVKGGKVLIPTEKYLAKNEHNPNMKVQNVGGLNILIER